MNRMTPNSAGASHPVAEEKRVSDYLRVLYKRRWIAIPLDK